MRAGIYTRVSTSEQSVDNQLHELRSYADARSWTVTEYTDVISGAKDRRPALDRMLKDARRRRLDSVVCWRLDRLGRSLKHLVNLLDELQALGVSFVSLNEGIDLGTPSGRLQLRRAKRQGQTLGRPRLQLPQEAIEQVRGLSVRVAARKLCISPSAAHRLLYQKPC